MCGIFGAIGNHINIPTLRVLAVLNQERGSSACGFYNSESEYFKDSVSAQKILRTTELRDWFIHCMKQRSWAICGHTRAPSRGANTAENAHPFRFPCKEEGHAVVGAHNGHCTAPQEHAVDSMYLFDLLSKAPAGDYQAALGEVAGWYAISWRDTRNENVYLLNWRGDIAFNKIGSTHYFSSNHDHLHTATSHAAHVKLAHGDVYRFGKDGSVEKMPDFKGKVWEQAKTQWQQGTSYYSGNTQANITTRTSIKDDDALPIDADGFWHRVEHKDGIWVECHDGAWRHILDEDVKKAIAK